MLVLLGHSEAVNIEFENEISAKKAQLILHYGVSRIICAKGGVQRSADCELIERMHLKKGEAA